MSVAQIEKLTKRVNGVVQLLEVMEKSKDKYKAEAKVATAQLDELTAEVMKLLDDLRSARECYIMEEGACENETCKNVSCLAHGNYKEPDIGIE